MFATDETITAICSPPGEAIRGIVRVCGPSTIAILGEIGEWNLESARRAAYLEGRIDLGEPLGLIDASILLWPDEHSYTGMPSAEIQLPGCQPILNAALQQVLDHGGRLAAPGEFTMRAFLAGRLDLTEAEAVLGVIDAEDRRSLDASLRQLSGGLSQPISQLRSELLNLLAHLEAGLDFVEEDIEFIEQSELLASIRRIAEQIVIIREQMQYRDAPAGSPRIVLRGKPNVGKSSLINALGGEAVAIVSDRAGTTRDCVLATVNFGDFTVEMLDTAGVEDADNEISRQSQELGQQASDEAALVLDCCPLSANEPENIDVHGSDVPILRVGTKLDACDGTPDWINDDWVLTSAVTGEGIETLRHRIAVILQTDTSVESGTVASTAVRCRETLSDATAALQRCEQIIESGLGDEFVAAELRIALDAIGRVTGVVYTDDILDRIFSEFCIGK